jgi:hypothetical protein
MHQATIKVKRVIKVKSISVTITMMTVNIITIDIAVVNYRCS